MSMEHEQVFVKVNAQCDKGIASLVKALNEIEGVITLDSCQKGLLELGQAFVFFSYGNSWQDLAQLLQAISSAMAEQKLDFGYTLRIEWFGSNECPRCQIVVAPDNVDTLAANIRALSQQISARMCQLAGDRPSIELRILV